TVNVTAGSGCNWIASSSAGWITITAGLTGSGNGTVSYSAQANAGTSRSGSLTIAGQNFTVNQAAAVSVDTQPPTVSMTAPANGTTLSGTASLSANASDNIAVTKVEFYCDNGILLGSDTLSPYSTSPNTTTMANGSHTLYCKAYDAAGNSSTSGGISVTINNAVQTGTWVSRYGGTASDSGTAVAVDATGNILVAGYFQGSMDLGGSPLVSAGGYDVFLAKFSAAGVHQWSKRFGGSGDEFVNAIALDGSGAIFLAGYFSGTANLGGPNLPSAGQQDGFLAKYDSQGNHQWSQGIGGLDPDIISSV